MLQSAELSNHRAKLYLMSSSTEHWVSPIFWAPQNPERDKWIGSAARLLAAAHGDKEPNENLVEWAVSLAENFYDDPEESLSPEDAVELELSYC